MARLNITIPDALYARLEQLRDRINLSKVCATALEKEVTMLEGKPNITDPRIVRLVQRLQSMRERWYQRGYDDGIQRAVELATRQELQSVATHLAAQDGQQLAVFFHKRHFHQQDITLSVPPLPQAPPLHPPMVQHAEPLPPLPPASQIVFYHQPGVPFPGLPESFHPAERLQYWENQDRDTSEQQGETMRIEVDEAAYLEGWRDAIKGIWQTISPALSQVHSSNFCGMKSAQKVRTMPRKVFGCT
jgi:hypothetical protein